MCMEQLKTKMADEILDPAEAVDHFLKRLNDEVSNQIRLLLEEKHLYQKVKIDRIEEFRREALRRVPKEARWIGSLPHRDGAAAPSLLDQRRLSDAGEHGGRSKISPMSESSNCPVVLPHL